MGIILGALAVVTAAAVGVIKAVAIVGLAIDGIRKIADSIMGLGKSLGLINPEVEVDELGDKALQAEEAGIHPGGFPSYAEYFKKVEDYELDPEKSKEFSEEEKMRKGMELSAGIAIEAYEGFPMEELCIAVGKNPEFFTEAKIQEIGKLVCQDGQYVSDIVGYINGTEKNDSKVEAAIQMLTEVEKAADHGKSEKEALQSVLGLRE